MADVSAKVVRRIEKAAATKAKRLDLAACKLTAIPPAVLELRDLTVLKLDDNAITSLAGISKLTRLFDLQLSGNPISELPDEIGTLTALAKLDVRDTKLKTFPAAIGGCSALAELYAGYSTLRSLPPEIGSLAKLHTLMIMAAELTELPPEIGKCVKLAYVDVSRNALVHLPRELGACKKLYNLGISGNKLVDLPVELAGLDVGNLDLTGNPLTKMPALKTLPWDEAKAWLASQAGGGVKQPARSKSRRASGSRR